MLPVSLPSLALCLRVWINNGISAQDIQHVTRTLGFSNSNLLGMELLPRYRELNLVTIRTITIMVLVCLNTLSIVFFRPKPIPEDLSFPGWKALASMEVFCNLEHQSRIHLDSSQ